HVRTEPRSGDRSARSPGGTHATGAASGAGRGTALFRRINAGGSGRYPGYRREDGPQRLAFRKSVASPAIIEGWQHAMNGPDAERHRNIAELFTAALARPAEERPQFLVEQCIDSGIRDQVAALLASDQ